MKKHKILIVALAMAVMCTGAGYAYWTQTLTIDNTVNTGYLTVGFVDPTEIADWDDRGWSDLVTVEADIADDGQSLDFTVGNFYPGAGASLGFVVQNTGTVAAKIDTVTGAITDNTALCNALNYTFDKVEVYYGGLLTGEYIIEVDANNVPDLASGLTNALDDITIQPGETLLLKSSGWLFTGIGGEEEVPGYEILMPETITGSQFEDDSASFSLALNFTQVN